MITQLYFLNDRDPYTIEQRNVIDDAIASVQSLLKFMKHDPLPLHLY